MKTEIDLDMLAGRLAAQDAVLGLLTALVIDGKPSMRRRLVRGLQTAEIEAIQAGSPASARIIGDRLATITRDGG